MTDEPAVPGPDQLRASDADRERVAKILHDAMAEGRLTMSELEERLAATYAAKTIGELAPLTHDLPGAQPPAATRSPTAQPPSTAQPTSSRPTVPGHGNPAPAPAHDRVGGEPTSRVAIAMMSGTDRKGPWVAPPLFNAFAFWGGVEIDLTQARFAEHEITVQATALMGAVEILVPQDVIVHVNGVGIMGAFENHARSEAPEGSPVVRVVGLALMGGVEVKNPKTKRKGAGKPRIEE